ncbi:putative ribonucleotide transport ATP-binding protein mkl [Oligella sp. MSHR50489EDL]|uniref:ABC transporter ATP-binding protein n=1 Tax=Oligella sp. MSHR50489EDL TaxID=3139409 RepID=UPI003D81818A
MSESKSSAQRSEHPDEDREVVIKVRGLRNQFGSHVVHENLDLDVYRGDILGVVGGSGTGKSVLLRSIVGLITPAAGEVTVFGKTLSELSEKERDSVDRQMGVLFQQGALYSSLTVKENIAFPLIEQLGMSRSEAEDLAMMKIFLVGLSAVAADRYPSELSGGMIKRAALARSLALDPAILFLDEPTAGLDPIGAANFDELIMTLRDALGLTIFLVTHDMDTLYTACDKIAVLSDKKVLISAPIEEVKKVDNEWIQAYFNGPRGRAAYSSHKQKE